jgi:hypothetical protein
MALCSFLKRKPTATPWATLWSRLMALGTTSRPNEKTYASRLRRSCPFLERKTHGCAMGYPVVAPDGARRDFAPTSHPNLNLSSFFASC